MHLKSPAWLGISLSQKNFVPRVHEPSLRTSRESEVIQRAAAEFLHDRHLLGAFVGGLVRDAHAPEDVNQEVWLRLAAEVERGTVK